MYLYYVLRQPIGKACAKVNKMQNKSILIVEVPEKTMSDLKERTRLRGSVKALAKKARVNRNTITNVIQRGTADSLILKRITKALQSS